MSRIRLFLAALVLTALPAAALADTSAADGLLGGSSVPSSLQTGSPQSNVPQTSNLQPEPDFVNQAPAASANALQGETPTDQEKLFVQGEGTPTPLATSSSAVWWWLIGLIVLVAVVGYGWSSILRQPSTPTKQVAPASPKKRL